MPDCDNATPHPASFYDQQVRTTIPYYDIFHDETIRLIKTTHPEPELWLDTGCGTGSLVMKAQRHFTKTTFLLADPSPEMMRMAYEKLKNVPRIKFLDPAATQHLQLENTMDVITAIQAHHYLAPSARKLATQICYAGLKKGGIYVTFENIRPLTTKGIVIGKQLWADYQSSQGKDSQSVLKHLDRFDSEFFPITVEEHISLLREQCFSVAEMLWYSTMQAGFYGIK